MKKKTLLYLLGATIGGTLAYYLYTMKKIKDVGDDTLEPNNDLDEEPIFDDDLDFDWDIPKASDKSKNIQFDNIENDDVFQKNSPLQAEKDEGDELIFNNDDELENTNESIISNTPLNILDYDTSYFELVCNISREDAIKLILKEKDTYTEGQLKCLTNSELADIYSEIINN